MISHVKVDQLINIFKTEELLTPKRPQKILVCQANAASI